MKMGYKAQRKHAIRMRNNDQERQWNTGEEPLAPVKQIRVLTPLLPQSVGDSEGLPASVLSVKMIS